MLNLPVVKQVRLHPRLAFSTAVALCIAGLLSNRFPPITRALIAWDAGTLLYLLLAFVMISRSTLHHLRLRASLEDDGARIVLLFAVAAGIASVAAIIAEFSGAKNMSPHERELHLGLVALTLICSWTFVHVSFALHYTHEYYVSKTQPALEFPHLSGQGDDIPDYWDFMYFSFVIGTTSQTADVNIVSRAMRRLALLHGVVAFFFNTSLLALAINIAAGLL